MPYQVDSPLASGIGAAAASLQGFADAKNAKAERDRQAELDRQHAIAATVAQQHVQNQDALDNKKYDLDVKRYGDEQTDKTNAAKLAAKKEADDALHQAREDALNVAKLTFERTKDTEAYKAAMAKIASAYAIQVSRAKTATSVAQIRAAATEGAASIRASATIQAAGMHEAGADRRAAERNSLTRSMFDTRNKTTIRGQDLTAGAKANALNAGTQKTLQGAMSKLAASDGAPSVPTDDPHFNDAVGLFVNDTPADRDKLLANPKVPETTKAYLRALIPFIPSQGKATPISSPSAKKSAVNVSAIAPIPSASAAADDDDDNP